MRATLHETFERASEAAESSRHAAGLLLDLFHLRSGLARTLDTMARGGDRDRLRAAVLREVELAALRNPARFDVEGRAELIGRWTEILVEAAEKVRSDRRDAELYAAARDERDVEDQALLDTAAELASQRWQDD
jgi:hypothetical protein